MAEAPFSAPHLQAMHSRYVFAYEAERKQIVSYLNDTTLQSLFALHMQLMLLLNESNLPEQTENQVAEAAALVTEIVEGLTRITRSLLPVELDTLGLNRALQQASDSFSQLSGIHVHYKGDAATSLSERSALAFYRLMQEAFVNILKHAQATEVDVSLQADDQQTTLVVADNGSGFESGKAILSPLATGLLHHQVIFEELGGQVILSATEGEGVRITAVLPVSPAPSSSSPDRDSPLIASD